MNQPIPIITQPANFDVKADELQMEYDPPTQSLSLKLFKDGKHMLTTVHTLPTGCTLRLCDLSLTFPLTFR